MRPGSIQAGRRFQAASCRKEGGRPGGRPRAASGRPGDYRSGWPGPPAGADEILTTILIILGLTLLNGIFAGAEIAVVSARRTRISELAEQGSRGAKAVARLRKDPDRFFATVQIGITVISASAAALGGQDLSGKLAPALEGMGLGQASHQVAFVLVVGGISFLSLVLGELVPKSLGLRYAEGYSLLVARPLVGLSRLARPLVWLFTASSNLVLRAFGDKTTFSEARLSAEELQQLVEDAGRTGSVDQETSEIASRALELKDVAVGAVMVPRNRIVAIDRGASLEEIRSVVLDSGHSRVPVKQGSVENLVGYVVAKDLLRRDEEGRDLPLEKILRPAWYVPETMRALDALRQLQARRLQLAIVVDERGTVAGLVTVEDLVEEVVGEIVSEHERPVDLAVRLEDGRFEVQGTAPIRDVNRDLEISLPEGEDYTTVAGLCIALAGRIPAAQETFTTQDGSRLEVLEASPRRIRKVAITPPPREERAEGERAPPEGEEGPGAVL